MCYELPGGVAHIFGYPVRMATEMWFELFLNWLLLPQVRASLPEPPLPLVVSYNSEKSLCGTDLSHRPHQRDPGGLPLLRVVEPAPPRRRLAGRQARRRHPSSLAHAAARPGPSVPAGARVSSDLPGRWCAPGYRLRIVCMRYFCVEFACKCLRDNACLENMYRFSFLVSNSMLCVDLGIRYIVLWSRQCRRGWAAQPHRPAVEPDSPAAEPLARPGAASDAWEDGGPGRRRQTEWSERVAARCAGTTVAPAAGNAAARESSHWAGRQPEHHCHSAQQPGAAASTPPAAAPAAAASV